jgi:hypothetical protein
MNPKKETLGLVFGSISVLTFWVPPYGLAFGVTGLVIALVRFKQKRGFTKTAIVISSLGIALFVAFWGTIWVLSQ